MLPASLWPFIFRLTVGTSKSSRCQTLYQRTTQEETLNIPCVFQTFPLKSNYDQQSTRFLKDTATRAHIHFMSKSNGCLKGLSFYGILASNLQPGRSEMGLKA